jgi:hypothetical protein
MTVDLESELVSLSQALGQLKQEAAKAIAATQLGGERRQRRETARRWQACRRQARWLSATTVSLLSSSDAVPAETRDELEKALSFLTRFLAMGGDG